MRRPELWALLLCLCLPGLVQGNDPGNNTDSEPAGLSAVLASMARDTPGRLAFTETRNDPMLEETQQLTGHLEFQPPDTLIRTVDGPRGETVRIEDNRLTVERGGQVRRELSLDEQPPLAGFAAAFRGLMGNDPATLQAHYEIELHGDPTDWELRLTPRDRTLARFLLGMEIHGGEGQLREILTREAGGHESHMRLEPAKGP
ncbi:MAG: LolA-related protein [Thioalkalivibrio sp.]